MNQIVKNPLQYSNFSAQQAAARARMSRGRQQIRQPQSYQASVDGCGPNLAPTNAAPGWAQGYNQGGFFTGGDPASPLSMVDQPMDLAPAAFGGSAGMVRRHCFYLGVQIQLAPGNPVTYSVAALAGANFYISGVKSCNDCFQVLVNSISCGSALIDACQDVDAGIWNTDECWCCIEIGCTNTLTPAIITAQPFQTVSDDVFLNLAFVGIWDAGYGTCGTPYSWGYPSFPYQGVGGMGMFPGGMPVG